MDKVMNGTVVLNVPGLWNSGPDHWQTHWEQALPNCLRIEQRDWETPHRDEWVATIEAAVAARSGKILLTAHSLGCATVAYWAASSSPESLNKIQGALLVAPSDVEAPSYPSGTTGFAPMPLNRLPFPSIVVASTDDFYITPERARIFAAAWGSRYVEVGAQGHLGSAAKLGLWRQGQELLQNLIV